MIIVSPYRFVTGGTCGGGGSGEPSRDSRDQSQSATLFGTSLSGKRSWNRRFKNYSLPGTFPPRVHHRPEDKEKHDRHLRGSLSVSLRPSIRPVGKINNSAGR